MFISIGALSMSGPSIPRMDSAGYDEGQKSHLNVDVYNQVRHFLLLFLLLGMDSTEYYEEEIMRNAITGGPGFRETGSGFFFVGVTLNVPASCQFEGPVAFGGKHPSAGQRKEKFCSSI